MTRDGSDRLPAINVQQSPVFITTAARKHAAWSGLVAFNDIKDMHPAYRLELHYYAAAHKWLYPVRPSVCPVPAIYSKSKSRRNYKFGEYIVPDARK